MGVEGAGKVGEVGEVVEVCGWGFEGGFPEERVGSYSYATVLHAS